MRANTWRFSKLAWLTFILCIILLPQVRAQHVVQLSGLITLEDSLADASGIAVYVPHTSRGTYTNAAGFFSLPVLPGDSVVVAAMGYERQYILIPKNFNSQRYSTTIRLKQGSIALPTVDVIPWATERDLRMAVARLKLPKEANTEVDMATVQKKIQRTHYPMDAGANQKHGLQQQNRQMQGRYMAPSDVKLLSIPIR